MADTNVTLSDSVFDPEIVAPLLQAEFENQAIVATSTAVTTDNTLEGVPGSTVTFPRWTAMGEIEDITENDEIELDTFTQELSEAKIKEAAKGFGYTDTTDLVGLGNIEAEAIRQFGILTARKIDSDLIATAIATVTDGHRKVKGGTKRDSKPLTHTMGAAITWPGLVDALAVFGDDYDVNEFTGLFIRSEQRTQVMKDDVFLKASEIAASGGTGSMVRRGFIGELAGLPVFVTDRLPAGKNLLLKRSSLGLMYKRRPIIERDRDIRKRQNIVTMNMHYATKRMHDKSVLVLEYSGTTNP